MSQNVHKLFLILLISVNMCAQSRISVFIYHQNKNGYIKYICESTGSTYPYPFVPRIFMFSADNGVLNLPLDQPTIFKRKTRINCGTDWTEINGTFPRIHVVYVEPEVIISTMPMIAYKSWSSIGGKDAPKR